MRFRIFWLLFEIKMFGILLKTELINFCIFKRGEGQVFDTKRDYVYDFLFTLLF